MIKIKASMNDKSFNFIRNFKDYPKQIAKADKSFITNIIFYMQRIVRPLTPVGAFQLLRGSIFTNIKQSADTSGQVKSITGMVATNSVYAAPVEFGTKPHMPPVAPIELWVRRKLKKSPQESKSIAWAIAKKIKARGTDGSFMFRDTFDRSRGYVKSQSVLLEKRIANIIKGNN